MSEGYQNSPFTVTRAAAVGYGLYYVLYSPQAGYGIGTMLTFAIGGAVMLGIVTVMEFQVARRRQRNRTDPTVPD